MSLQFSTTKANGEELGGAGAQFWQIFIFAKLTHSFFSLVKNDI